MPTAKAAAWKPERKFEPHEVKEAIASMPVEEQHRRVAPVLGALSINVAHRVREHLGDAGTKVIHKAAIALSKQVGGDLSPEAIDITTAKPAEVFRHLFGTDDFSTMDKEQATAAYYSMAAMLMKLSCDVLDALGDEKGQHVIEQAWEEIARDRMYWDLVSDLFDLDEMDAKGAIALLAGTDSLMGVQYDLGVMTRTYAERNITHCTPVAMAWKMGYSHDTVRKFCETVATSVCIRGPQALLPGLKVKYLTRMSYGDTSCIETAEWDPDSAAAERKPAGRGAAKRTAPRKAKRSQSSKSG